MFTALPILFLAFIITMYWFDIIPIELLLPPVAAASFVSVSGPFGENSNIGFRPEITKEVGSDTYESRERGAWLGSNVEGERNRPQKSGIVSDVSLDL